MKHSLFLGASILLVGLAATPAFALTQAQMNKACTDFWGPPAYHYTPNGCVKGLRVMTPKELNTQVRVTIPVSQKPAGAGPASISDQAAAGNLTSFRK
ncbi:hypothetical protein [Phenylobacterium sp.]|uniref:hypothetical protein n=1 Tax=Phenylobacterium sp. TaxID=1871053 RepID=UPI002732403A|nr:hypothetical protein [Phenylobacterium sp.]MDP3634208.1 hypothetical protein [Phenylobacterium sp.]MDZ4053215.1 hypothetical protein [Phenylobacterium sp.]